MELMERPFIYVHKYFVRCIVTIVHFYEIITYVYCTEISKRVLTLTHSY